MSYGKALVLVLMFSWLSLAYSKPKTVSGLNEMDEQDPATHQDDPGSVTNVRSKMSQLILKKNKRMFSTVHTEDCYQNFFVNSQPPTGLRADTSNIKYICQQLPGNDAHPYYATMFDEQYGIAVYSAYFINEKNVKGISNVRQNDGSKRWRPEAGIKLQGTDDTYKGSKYQRGHLLPANIYSFSKDYLRSTFAYTNAVPQSRAFNQRWYHEAERKIVNFARTICPKSLNGVLYLITGTTVKTSHPKKDLSDEELTGQGTYPIKVPGSIWTAGCCLETVTVVKNFALISGNLNNSKVVELTVEDLQNFLTSDDGITTNNITLFPGNPDCSKTKNYARIG